MSASEESLSEILGKGPAVSAPVEPAKGETAKPAEAAPPAAKETTTPVEESAEAKAARARDESGRFTKAEEKAAEKVSEKPPTGLTAALIDERRKRQESDRRYAELLSRQQTPIAKPSVFENEDAAISARMDESNQPIREAIYKLSVKTARALYKDFGEAEQAFSEAMEKDDRLVAGLRASDDPGEYIYSMGIHVRELADVGGDLMKYRDKVTGSMKSEIESRDVRIKALEAELAAAKEAQTELANIPRSLNGTSSGASPKAGDGDPEDLKQIVRFGNKPR